jgi:hypothetical protein
MLAAGSCSTDLLTARRLQSKSAAAGVTMGKGCRAERGQIHQPADLQQNAFETEAITTAAEKGSHHWGGCQAVGSGMQV